MDLNTAIRTGVFSALSGSVLYNGENVSVYDAFGIPDTGVFDEVYVLLSTQSYVERSAKTGARPKDATVQIDVVTRFLNPVGRETAENIMGQIDSILNPESRHDIDLSALGFIIGDTTLISSNDISTKSDAYYVFRKINTYSLIVSKT